MGRRRRGAVLRILPIDEPLDVGVVEETVIEVGVQQTKVRRHPLLLQREGSIFPVWISRRGMASGITALSFGVHIGAGERNRTPVLDYESGALPLSYTGVI